jgi:hypothetical protein
MTTKPSIPLIIATFFIILAAALATAPRHAEGADHGVDQLPGSWLAEITISPEVSFPALFTFTRDGALIATESPGPFESPSHGNWIRRAAEMSPTRF